MNITSAQYLKDDTDTVVSMRVIIDGLEWNVPLIEGNRHYDEVMRQVAAGELTIADAE